MNNCPRFYPARICLALALVFPGIARSAGDGLTLDHVAVTGSRVEHSTFDFPAAVDVIGAGRIHTDQARVNASEALAGVPGIAVQNRQNYAQDLQISSRGFGARSAFGVRGVRLVADGIPASMPDGQGQAATFNLDRAERIEVLRGPMSAIYGNHAGGVIQLFTPDGQGAPTVDGHFLAGSYGTWKSDVGVQGESGGIGYVLDASRFSTDGYRDQSAARRDQSMAKLSFRPSADGKLTLLANYFQQEAEDPQGLNWDTVRDNPRSVSATTLQYNTRKSIEHKQGGASYEHRFGDHRVQVSAYLGQRSTVQYQSIARGTQLASPLHSGGVVDFRRDFAGLTARWIGRFDLAGGKLTTTLGTDYEQSTDDRRGYENFIGTTTFGVRGTLRRNEEDRVFSADQYAQAEWQGERWTFSGGLRHSRIAFKVDDRFLSNGDDSGTLAYEKTTPTLGALYRLTPAVNLYVSAARGFEAPTFNEMFYSSNGGSFNFALKPSTSTHYEAGLKAFVGADSRLDLAVFQIATQDELVVKSSDGGRTAYQNAGETLRRGVELAFDTRWSQRWSSRLAYTFIDARYDEAFTFSAGTPPSTRTVNAGNRIPGVAAQTLFADLTWKHPASGFHAAVESVARSQVFVEDTNTDKPAPGYAVANLRAGLERTYGATRVAGFVRLDNVFDKQYVGSVIVGDGFRRYYESAPGRNWLVGVNLRHRF